MGFSCSPSCPQVIASNSSSMVPQPPGKATNQLASADITALRSWSELTMRISLKPVCAISRAASARGSTPITSAPPSSAPIKYDSRAPALDPAKTQIRFISLPHHALEDRVDMPELALQIEAFGQLLRLAPLLDLGILG